MLGRPARVLGVGITWKMLENYWVGKRLSTGVHDPEAWRRAGTQRQGKCRPRLADARGRWLEIAQLTISARIAGGRSPCRLEFVPLEIVNTVTIVGICFKGQVSGDAF